MSRSGYTGECDNPALWRQAVDLAILGTRGQAFMKRLRAALDAMPNKRLIAHEIADAAGDVCALGAVDPTCHVDPEDGEAVAAHFGIAHAMASEIVYMNDEYIWHETPERRWERMRAWVAQQIGPEEA